ncbi:MAG: hypothetical protein NXI24_08290 [bacterium]|nr:hypothetical protein [bacterium]
MSQNEIELTQSQLLITGSLTGAASHELNNIMGILSLRLEKVQDDLGTGPGGCEEAMRKDLAVMQRNLERAVALIGHLQWLMRAGGDTRMCGRPEEVQMAIIEAIQTQQAIYERKAAVDHAVSLVNIRPVLRGCLHLFVIAALQRVILSLGRGSVLKVDWSVDSQTGDGRLVIRGEDSGAAGATPTAPRMDGALQAVLELLAGQTEELAAKLAPGEIQLAEAFQWSEECVADGVGGETRRTAVILSLRLPAADS